MSVELYQDLPNSKNAEPFDREESGLVDLDCYRPYLVDNVDEVPIRLQKEEKNKSKKRFVYQHVFFTEDEYWQTHLAQPERDRRYRALREQPYSLVAMRAYMELQLHLDKEPSVHYPPQETVDKTLLDYFDLDLIAAASLGIKEIKNPGPVDPWTARYEPPIELKTLTPEERVGIFETKLEELLTKLESPRVLPEKVVCSALLRLAQRVQSNKLRTLAKERSADGYFFPLGVPKLPTVRDIGRSVLKDAMGLVQIENSRHRHQSLQLIPDSLVQTI